ncbi:hypothetical protein QJS10_CPB20g00232 [Acorus calamus]|uniref:Gamma-interferon-inducible lysosomal thiol reductase n=1 Tax=Acorus calamus TaxID=4465 RepID=A0AAV9C9B4_ACOCL|nr:hypothetical protein QJS10_CPB20g00232 [Acorus calamus]
MESSLRPLHLLLLAFAVSLSFPSPPSIEAAPSSPPRKVRLSLYYETLCPYCSRFMVKYLPKIFDDGLFSVVDLELVPYGNARIVDSNGTIACQHGPYECLLNTVEACAIDTWPDLATHFQFIYCVERLVVERKYTDWESCFQATGLDSQAVLNCYNNGRGKQLELQYASRTNALQPPHTYVPWVVVDGQPLYDDYENFESYICKAYKGNPPRACESLAPSKIRPGVKANPVDRVCYTKQTVSASAT